MEVAQKKINTHISLRKVEFKIPRYQRHYDWKEAQCKQLLDDIIRLGENSGNTDQTHFIGSIVFIKDQGTHFEQHQIIDGQQRLTTLTLIYIVLYQIGKAMRDEDMMSVMHQYLMNHVRNEEYELKLKTSPDNQQELNELIENGEITSNTKKSNIARNYNFFKQHITIENYEIVQRGLNLLNFIYIELTPPHDEAQRIFESLNSTGKPLSQTDLIRNYILMDLPIEQQKVIYQDYWAKIEHMTMIDGINKIEDFMRDYLIGKKNKVINQEKIYDTFKKVFHHEWNYEKIKKYMQQITFSVQSYHFILNPEKEKDKELKQHLQYMKSLNISVCNPFLLQLMNDYRTQELDKQTVIEIIEVLQSYLLRRLIVGRESHGLNTIFAPLYHQCKQKDNNVLTRLKEDLTLRMGGNVFPTNIEVEHALINSPFYSRNAERNKVIRYLFERIEKHMHPKENVNMNTEISIEHVFPQNPNKEWKQELSVYDYDYMKEKLNTIPNLTLTGENNKLSNHVFSTKTDVYKKSNFQLTRELANFDKWSPHEYRIRCKTITTTFLQIWKYPEVVR